MKSKSFLKHNFFILSLVTIIISCTYQNPNKASLPADQQKEKNIIQPNKAKETETPQSKIQNVQTTIINSDLNSDFVPRIPATIKTENQSSIGFLTGGSITNIYARSGTEVKLGQLLASLEDNQAQIDVKSAKIEVSKKKINVTQQEIVVQRIEKQFKSGIVNLATLEKEKNNLQLNILELQSAQAALEGKEFTLKSTKLYAPYTGVISKVLKSIGDYVSTGTAVMQITQTKNYKLFAQVPITYFNKITVGMKLDIINPITGNHGEAIIKRVVPVIDPSLRTFDVYAEVTAFTDKLAPGVFLEIKLKSK